MLLKWLVLSLVGVGSKIVPSQQERETRFEHDIFCGHQHQNIAYVKCILYRCFQCLKAREYHTPVTHSRLPSPRPKNIEPCCHSGRRNSAPSNSFCRHGHAPQVSASCTRAHNSPSGPDPSTSRHRVHFTSVRARPRRPSPACSAAFSRLPPTLGRRKSCRWASDSNAFQRTTAGLLLESI
jgi:hypothetical protein